MGNLEYLIGTQAEFILAAIVAMAALVAVRASVQAWGDAVKLDQEDRSTAERLVSPFASQLTPQTEIQVRALRQQLVRAGLREERDMRRFTMARVATLGAAVALVAGLRVVSSMSLINFIFAALGTMYLSVKLPDFWLSRRIRTRQERIARALPSLIDLMVLCLDVGLSVEAAFERVASELRSVEPLLAEESGIMVSEMGAGLIFPHALKRMAERVDIYDLTTMARLISQANQLGASITTALREYSEQSFSKRLMSLEEHAGKVSAYLVMPLTACMLPACLLALTAPAITMLMQTIGN